MIRILALLCSLASPTDCNWTTVTSSDIEQLQMSDCYNQAKIADWMKQHPAERIAKVTCVFGNQPKKEHA